MMKIIDLLNKIANEAEVPKKIKYEGEIYEFNKNIHGYWGGKNKDCFRAMVNWRYLNNEVEILEEDNKIEKLELIENGDLVEIPGSKDLMNKINELIDEVNKLKENK